MGRTTNEQSSVGGRWVLVLLLVSLLGWSNSGGVSVQGQESRDAQEQTIPKLEPVAIPSPSGENTRGWLPTGVLGVRDSVLRIDIFEDDVPRGSGTGFIVAVHEDHALLVTCSHVLDHKASQRDSIAFASAADKRRIHFKAVHPKSGATFDVVGGKFHPDFPRGAYQPQACPTERMPAMTNDVAVVKIRKPSNAKFPAAFNLAVDENLDELQGAEVHLWGFPGEHLVESTKPFYSRGTVSQTDDRNRWLMYDTTAVYGASGAPVFVVSTDSQTGQRRAQVVGVHFSGTCDLAGRAKNLGYAVNIRQSKSILQKAENGEFDFGKEYLVDPPETPIVLQGIASGDDPKSSWPTFEDIQKLSREGQIKLALDRLGDLIAKMEGMGIEIPTRYQILQARLMTDFGKTIVGRRQPNDSRSANGHETAQIRLTSEEILLNSANLLRRLVDANGDDLRLNLMYLRAEQEYARLRTPVDIDRLKWAHGRVNELLKTPKLRNEDIARCLFLRGIAHFYLPTGGRTNARQDFANSFSKFASRQSEEWLLFMDGYGNTTSKKPDLWEGMIDEQQVEANYAPLTPVLRRQSVK